MCLQLERLEKRFGLSQICNFENGRLLKFHHGNSNIRLRQSKTWFQVSPPREFVSKLSANQSGNVEINTLNKLVETIQNVQNGLDPQVLASWYDVIERESKALCPTEELSGSIEVTQNQVLPMKFEFKSSKRAIPYVVQAIEGNLNEMPYATRLYFQKFEEIMQKELHDYLNSPKLSDSGL